jgi:SMODS-associating 2TM, beta-strand rich effector domain
MKNIKEEALLWARLLGFVAIWATVLFATKTGLSINWEALKRLPDAVTIYVIIAFTFTKWLWRLPVFQGWLVPFPDLQGTWQGEFSSTWKDEAGKIIAPIPVTLVIRQTFSSISCALFTQESESYSTAAQISSEDDSGALYLNYNYTNRPKATIRDRSAIHDGAARLRIISVPRRSLEGEYWTGRCTTGDMSLKFRSKKLSESFRANS